MVIQTCIQPLCDKGNVRSVLVGPVELLVVGLVPPFLPPLLHDLVPVLLPVPSWFSLYNTTNQVTFKYYYFRFDEDFKKWTRGQDYKP